MKGMAGLKRLGIPRSGRRVTLLWLSSVLVVDKSLALLLEKWVNHNELLYQYISPTNSKGVGFNTNL